MKNTWWKGLTDGSAISQRRQVVMEHRKGFQILRSVLESELADVKIAQESKALYENPNWPYLQADYIGRVRALREVIDLLTIEEETK